MKEFNNSCYWTESFDSRTVFNWVVWSLFELNWINLMHLCIFNSYCWIFCWVWKEKWSVLRNLNHIQCSELNWMSNNTFLGLLNVIFCWRWYYLQNILAEVKESHTTVLFWEFYLFLHFVKSVKLQIELNLSKCWIFWSYKKWKKIFVNCWSSLLTTDFISVNYSLKQITK